MPDAGPTEHTKLNDRRGAEGCKDILCTCCGFYKAANRRGHWDAEGAPRLFETGGVQGMCVEGMGGRGPVSAPTGAAMAAPDKTSSYVVATDKGAQQRVPRAAP